MAKAKKRATSVKSKSKKKPTTVKNKTVEKKTASKNIAAKTTAPKIPKGLGPLVCLYEQNEAIRADLAALKETMRSVAMALGAKAAETAMDFAAKQQSETIKAPTSVGGMDLFGTAGTKKAAGTSSQPTKEEFETELREAAAKFSTDAVGKVVEKHGFTRMTQVKPEKYAAILDELAAL